MKKAVILAVLATSLLPGLALAECMGQPLQTAASCVPGMVWDAGAGTCVENPTS
jgi:hypothetical protein